MRDIIINPNKNTTASALVPTIQFLGLNAATIKLDVEDNGSLVFRGNSGGLFSITDTATGLLHSVNDISGLPIFSVYSNDKIVAGGYLQNALTVDYDKVFIATDTISVATGTKLYVNGNTIFNGVIQITGGTPGTGKVLTSDASGNATWQVPTGGGGGTTYDDTAIWNALNTHNHDTLYSSLNHNHDGQYSPLGHVHNNYADENHNHDDTYAPLDHNHSGVYAPAVHNHDTLYSSLNHNHNGTYSPVGHGHNATEISGTKTSSFISDFTTAVNSIWDTIRQAAITFAETITFAKASIHSWATGNSVLALDGDKKVIEIQRLDLVISDTDLITYLQDINSWLGGAATTVPSSVAYKGEQGQQGFGSIGEDLYIFRCTANGTWLRDQVLIDNTFKRASYLPNSLSDMDTSHQWDLSYSMTVIDNIAANATLSLLAISKPTRPTEFFMRLHNISGASRTVTLAAGNFRWSASSFAVANNAATTIYGMYFPHEDRMEIRQINTVALV
jgi:hypothetical protein